MTIGAVCKALVQEFPDISISKIRYLEDQKLLSPRRTQGGYRLYTQSDIQRLRTILRLQRDEFLPLRVIRQELAGGRTDREVTAPGDGRALRRTMVTTRDPGALYSLEDVVEIIVGDIEDEHDDDNGPMVVADRDGGFVADARADIDEVAEAIGAELAAGEEGEDIDTIGGLVFSLLGRVPVRGELLSVPGGFEIEILDADPRRIKRLRIYRPQNERQEPRRRPKPPAEPGADA